MRVEQIKTDKAKPFILKKHYAKRMPSVSYAFGLFTDDGMVGVVTFGAPVGINILKGICGEGYEKNVIELNRLVINENVEKNSASFLVSGAIKQLGDIIVVSYADTKQNHNGYIYQACNFMYAGLTVKRKDQFIVGMEHLHSKTVADLSRGQKDRPKYMRETYGDRFSLRERSRKHRYIIISGSKTFKKYAMRELKYKSYPYPKEESKRYECIDIPTKTTLMDFIGEAI